MSIQKIEEYRQKDGTDILKVYCKPTSKYPEGSNYFYVDNRSGVVELIHKYTWYLSGTPKSCNVIAVTSKHNSWTKQTLAYFHRLYAEMILGQSVTLVDHINGWELDNTSQNLRFVDYKCNARNRPSRGYFYTSDMLIPFRVMLQGGAGGKEFYKTEKEALERVNELRNSVYDDFDYDFKLDFRDSLDLLDAERTGLISHEEAIYQHVSRKVTKNAWYAYRYNLFEYCKKNKIKIPDTFEDEYGFLVDSTGNRICPF